MQMIAHVRKSMAWANMVNLSGVTWNLVYRPLGLGLHVQACVPHLSPLVKDASRRNMQLHTLCS